MLRHKPSSSNLSDKSSFAGAKRWGVSPMPRALGTHTLFKVFWENIISIST